MSAPSRSGLLLRRANGWLTVLWAVMIPVSIFTPLRNSVPYLVGLSVWALFASHLSAWAAGRAEVASEENP